MGKLKQFPRKDILLNTKLYDEYIHDYEMNNGWLPGNQEYNFNELLKLPYFAGVPLTGTSILDVGCGTGDLVPFLTREHIASYIGIDIYEPSLKQARKKHPEYIFIEGDLLLDVISELSDYAFCSGAFTIKISANNYDFLEAMLTKMWDLTRIGLAFNVLTDDDPDPDSDLFFYNPEKVRKICHTIDKKAEIVIKKTSYVSQIHVFMYRRKHMANSE